MENAAKALIIAAGILIVVMILSLVMMFYNQVSDYYQSESDRAIERQTADFNKNFENYHREQVRGTDLISLMNRVINYNETQTYQDGTNYERIEVTIDLIDDDVINQFKYPTTELTIDNIIDDVVNSSHEITNRTTSNDEDDLRAADNRLAGITGIEAKLLNELTDESNGLGVSNPTPSQLQTLAANIGNIMIDDNVISTDSWTVASTKIANRLKRADLIESTLNIELQINEAGEAIGNSQNIIDKIKEIALQYYQFTQFKRAYFDCTDVIYDTDTGRISSMNFEIRIGADGNVEFN